MYAQEITIDLFITKIYNKYICIVIERGFADPFFCTLVNLLLDSILYITCS